MLAEFLSQIVPPLTGEELFDHLADVVYFIKDAQGAYLVVNQTLVTRCGVADKQALLGRTPVEVLRPPLGQQFAEQDQHVLRTGTPLIGQLELHIHPTGHVGWCLTTKLPLRNRHKRVIGLVGVSQDLRLPDVQTAEYRQVAAAIEFAEKQIDAPPSVSQLASLARMSRYQLDRRMRLIFGLTTGQWLVKIRLDAAQRLLRDTDLSIAAIAQEAGYGDQSAFTRQFRQATGLPPGEYRTAHRRTP
ncbi:MAG: AraC family transcriptional regulator [Planctomycetes bacterium]|nr:AraC family transcriptional regulator [Planctomycetota bacterium]